MNKDNLDINQNEEHIQLQKMKMDDESALEYFFTKYYKYLVVTAYNILHEDAKAKDIVQEVYLKFWNKRQELKIQQVKPYLRRAVYNKCIDDIRKQKKQGTTEEITEINHPQISSSIINQLEVEELQNRINKAIDLLPNRCRTIFCLSRLENLSHKEIAEQLDISTKTIENQITKALKIMRKHINIIYLLIIILYKLLDI